MLLFTHPHDLLSYMETERDILKNVVFTFFHEITKQVLELSSLKKTFFKS